MEEKGLQERKQYVLVAIGSRGKVKAVEPLIGAGSVGAISPFQWSTSKSALWRHGDKYGVYVGVEALSDRWTGTYYWPTDTVIFFSPRLLSSCDPSL